MALPINIADLLSGSFVESERIEFKKGWNPLATLHTLSAFANDFHNLGGGYLVIGVEEKDGQPVMPPAGLPPGQLDSIQKEILNLGHSALQPYYHPVIDPVVIDGKHVLILWAPGGQTRPYRAKLGFGKDCNEWGYFIRKGSSTVRAKGADEQELLSLAATVPFDDRVHHGARVEDISRDLILAFLKEIHSDLASPASKMPLAKLGRQMAIISGPEEAPIPINVGLLFFNEHPEAFFPATQIDVVWFPDGPGADKFEEKIFRGPLGRIVREAIEYIRRNFISETVIKHPGRAEATRIVNFPFEAIEEAVVNAVYHRSYEIREPIEIRISPQEFVVLSFPGPDRSIRLDDLQEGRAVSRRYRNRRIGEFLKELDLTEGRATGIPKILRAMRDNGSPAPQFETDDDRSFFLIRLPVHPSAKVTPEVTPQVAPQVTPQVEMLLRAFEHDHSREELQVKLGLADRHNFRTLYLLPALNDGLVEMTISGKPKSRLQKYRLTAKGRAFLTARKEGDSGG